MRDGPMAVRAAVAVLGFFVLAAVGCGGDRRGGEQQVQQQAAQTAAPANPLLDPNSPEMNQAAPDVYRVRFETSKGEFVVEVNRAWAPKGADRFYNLVRHGFYDGARFFRVVPGFVVQFGINGDPQISARWRTARIEDDPVTQSNRRGTVTFATAGPNSRTTQVFINYSDNTNLDGQGFAPFGRVVQGMDVVDRINAEYGQSPNQALIQQQGNAYLEAQFPRLDYIVRASVVSQ